MLLPKFDYFRPESLEEARSLLSKYKEKAKVIAGGTDLLGQMKSREVVPPYLINIKDIPSLDYIHYDDKEGLRIGALATIRAIETSSLIQQKFGILSQAASVLGSVQVRNRGTIGGNLCNAAPSAETAPALIALAARAKIAGAGRERTVDLEQFFVGPGQSVLQPDEILIEIQIPNLPSQSSGVYLKHGIRRAMDIAIVGVGVIITLDGERKACRDARIVLGSVAPTPLRVKKAEEVLKGEDLTKELIERAAQIASEQSRPIDDIRSSADYRRRMVKVLVRRAIEQAIGRIESGGS